MTSSWIRSRPTWACRRPRVLGELGRGDDRQREFAAEPLVLVVGAAFGAVGEDRGDRFGGVRGRGGGADRLAELGDVAVGAAQPGGASGAELRPERFADGDRVGRPGGHPQVVLQHQQLAVGVADQVHARDRRGRHARIEQSPHERLVPLRGLQQPARHDHRPRRSAGRRRRRAGRRSAPAPAAAGPLRAAPTRPRRSPAAPGRRPSARRGRRTGRSPRCSTGRARAAPPGPAARARRSPPRREGVRCRSWRTPRRSAPNRAGTRRRRERDGPDSRSSPCSHAKDRLPARGMAQSRENGRPD